MEVTSASPVAPGETVRFAIEWTSLIPHGGGVGRAGWVHDYHFIVQWFPKIAAWYKGHWNEHTFHPWTEFFSDFGVYDVRLTLPRGFVVGATGRLTETKANARRHRNPALRPGGRARLRLDGQPAVPRAQDAIRRGRLPAGRGAAPRPARARPPRRALSRGHEDDAARLRSAASAPYPYPQVTVIDPAWNSSSGGMEYPTLFTAGHEPLGPTRAARARGPDHPRVRPSVLVRPRGQQRVRRGVAGRGPELVLRGQDRVRAARALRVRPPLLRAGWGPRKPERLAGGRSPGVDRPRQGAASTTCGPIGQVRRDDAARLGLPVGRLLHRELLRQARPDLSDPRGPAGRRDHARRPAAPTRDAFASLTPPRRT